MTRLSLQQLDRRVVACRACPRLVTHCQKIARVKRASYRDESYWGRPVPNLLPEGDAGNARVLMVGLAPGAHGANRTGRMFTGDRSGDFLFRTLHEAGFASQPQATCRKDGLTLDDLTITAAAHCAPPDNRPTRDELARCAPFLTQTIDAMPRLRVILSLGRLAHDAVLREYRRRGQVRRLSDFPFGHAAEHTLPRGPTLLCSYHPSQQNTFTGRLTEPMLLAVLKRARTIAGRLSDDVAAPSTPASCR